MIEIIRKEECCGCDACVNICPKQCIAMEIDDEGFWYPKVDKKKCIGCNLCEKVCPTLSEPKIEKFDILTYGCKNKNLDTRVKSSSGGVFFLLAKSVIDNNGVVFGAAFDKEFEVCHTYSETLEGCEKFRGSKYVQSKIGDTYKLAKKFLDKGRLVLFTGTQCQIKGLNLYLKKNYDNLIAIDIICHGVPSPLVFRKYRENLSKSYNSNIKEISFRDKAKGWKSFSYVTKFEDGTEYSKTQHDDIYMKGFLKDLYLRPSCYYCSAKKFNTGADLSLADYWGIQNINTQFDDDKGVSLVVVNTSKGKKIFDEIANDLDVIHADFNKAVEYNPCLLRPSHCNDRREKFFKELKNKDINKLIVKYTKNTFPYRIKRKIKHILKL